MHKLLLVSSFISISLFASGYNIPEQSINSTALSAAYVANAHGADASYYNPANMVFNEGQGSFEIDMTYIYLTKINFQGDGPLPGADIDSKEEHFLIPTFHYVSPAVDDFRFGLSLTAPGGLAKRWSEAPGVFSADKFSLMTYEINPTISYKITDEFSVGGGIRGLYSKGKILISALPAGGPNYDLDADGFDWGYNLALSYKPLKELSLAMTYRSNIDMDLDIDASLTYPGGTPNVSDTGSGILPLPAVFRAALAYTFNEKTTTEFVYERNYWSEYESLNISFDQNSALNIVKPKNWKDTNTYRFGLTHIVDSSWTAMLGFAYDKSPIPEETLGFELPGSDSRIYSLGTRYSYSEELEFGASFLLLDKNTRSVTTNQDNINGTFKDASAYFFTLGVEYKF